MSSKVNSAAYIVHWQGVWLQNFQWTEELTIISTFQGGIMKKKEKKTPHLSMPYGSSNRMDDLPGGQLFSSECLTGTSALFNSQRRTWGQRKMNKIIGVPGAVDFHWALAGLWKTESNRWLIWQSQQDNVDKQSHTTVRWFHKSSSVWEGFTQGLNFEISPNTHIYAQYWYCQHDPMWPRWYQYYWYAEPKQPIMLTTIQKIYGRSDTEISNHDFVRTWSTIPKN